MATAIRAGNVGRSRLAPAAKRPTRTSPDQVSRERPAVTDSKCERFGYRTGRLLRKAFAQQPVRQTIPAITGATPLSKRVQAAVTRRAPTGAADSRGTSVALPVRLSPRVQVRFSTFNGNVLVRAAFGHLTGPHAELLMAGAVLLGMFLSSEPVAVSEVGEKIIEGVGSLAQLTLGLAIEPHLAEIVAPIAVTAALFAYRKWSGAPSSKMTKSS